MAIPISILAGLGASFLLSKKSWLSVILGAGIIFFISCYNIVKVNEFNPYKREMEYISTWLKPVQEDESDSKIYIFVFPADYKPYIAQTMAKSYGLADRVRLMQQDKEFEGDLDKILDESAELVEVRIMNTCKDKDRIERTTKEHGGAFVAEFTRFAKPERDTPRPSTLSNSLSNPFLAIIRCFEK
ncbi:MAG: hypothetical protein H6752_01345 [Candidatus Omnitrophica bacterium]|nr:hypothetical protein [Candidatus Omnitrophota bacterium]